MTRSKGESNRESGAGDRGKRGKHPRINFRLPQPLLDELENDERFMSRSEAARYAIQLQYDPNATTIEELREELVDELIDVLQEELEPVPADWRKLRARALGRDGR